MLGVIALVASRLLRGDARWHCPARRQDLQYLRRREDLLYGGARWPFAQQRAYVSPSLFVNRFVGGGSPDQADERAWQVKLSPAIDVVLDRQRQALLTLSLSMRLDEPGFGGGNTQVFIPF